MRRFGEIRRRGQRYRLRPGAYGVILRGRRALIALNACPGEEVALPGGGIDPGESPVQALHREVMEETGWRVAVQRRLGFYHRQIYMPEYGFAAHKVCHIYLCIAGRRVADPTEPDHQPVLVDLEVAQTALSLDAERRFAELLR